MGKTVIVTETDDLMVNDGPAVQEASGILDPQPTLPARSSKKLLTRAEAAARIGISITQIRRREISGQLRPVKRDKNGWNYFSSEDVDAQANLPLPDSLTRKSAQPGGSAFTPDEASNVFDALDAGKSLVDCVRECRLMPATVRLLAEEYASLTGALFLPKQVMDAINVLPLEGTFPLQSAKDLLAVLVNASADVCKGCSTRARTMCKPCALKLAARMVKDPL